MGFLIISFNIKLKEYMFYLFYLLRQIGFTYTNTKLIYTYKTL